MSKAELQFAAMRCATQVRLCYSHPAKKAMASECMRFLRESLKE